LWISGCQKGEPVTPVQFWTAVSQALAARDSGAVLVMVDLRYQDDVGGVGRLEDDLRQLFTVYGPLRVSTRDAGEAGPELSGRLQVEGRRLRFDGPLRLTFLPGPRGPLIGSGVLTDLRNILHSLRERRLALETAFPDRLDEVVSVEYKGKQGGKAELMEQVRGDLRAVKDTALITEELSIEAGAEEAEVTQSCLIVTHVGDKTLEDRLQERLRLRKEGSRWRFVGGLD
jgi:hypothetical protein